MSPLFALFIAAILIVVIFVVIKIDKPGPQSASNVVPVRLMSNDVLVRDQTFLNGVPTFVY